VPFVLAVALAGVAGGLNVAGVVGATAVSLVFIRHARAFSGAAKRFPIFAAWDSRSILSLPVW
jgi:hypothetical protein